MKKEEWSEGLDNLDEDIIEEYVEQKDKLRQKKKTKSIWLRFGVIAACMSLVVGAIIIVPMLKKNSVNVPVWDDAHYSAEDIADLFEASNKLDSVATNAYTKVYVPDAKYLNIGNIPDEKYLNVYQYERIRNKLNEGEFKEFIDSFLPKLAASLGAEAPKYEIEKNESYSDGSFLGIYENIGDYKLNISQHKTYYWLSVYKGGTTDGKIILDRETVRIDQRQSDEEIIKSISSIKNKLFDIFGVSFSDTKIIRNFDNYSEHGAKFIYIYFYNEDAHYLNTMQSRPVSDYIYISFDNTYNYADDIVSDDILEVADICYRKSRVDVAEEYKVTAKAEKISIEEAEALLYNGYVFGGHSCPLCMAMQDKISFDGYDYVEIEYVFGYNYNTGDPALGIPFYAFYKKIGTSKNGNIIYAKTYVAAIKVKDYENYFESQKDKHKNSLFDYFK